VHARGKAGPGARGIADWDSDLLVVEAGSRGDLRLGPREDRTSTELRSGDHDDRE
jgi:hypothetical protein